jgi:hypothetical protein
MMIPNREQPCKCFVDDSKLITENSVYTIINYVGVDSHKFNRIDYALNEIGIWQWSEYTVPFERYGKVSKNV